LYGTSVNPDRRQLKANQWSTSHTNSDTPSVPLSTSSPVQDFPNRLVVSEKSVTKAPVVNIKHNNIEDEDNSENILADSQTKNMYNHNEGLL